MLRPGKCAMQNQSSWLLLLYNEEHRTLDHDKRQPKDEKQ